MAINTMVIASDFSHFLLIWSLLLARLVLICFLQLALAKSLRHEKEKHVERKKKNVGQT
jgi:hypothetical protein